jgi:hypothetical protein
MHTLAALIGLLLCGAVAALICGWMLSGTVITLAGDSEMVPSQTLVGPILVVTLLGCGAYVTLIEWIGAWLWAGIGPRWPFVTVSFLFSFLFAGNATLGTVFAGVPLGHIGSGLVFVLILCYAIVATWYLY